MVKEIQTRSEWRFNIEIFREGGNKEIKVSNVSLDKFKVICDELYAKYG